MNRLIMITALLGLSTSLLSVQIDSKQADTGYTYLPCPNAGTDASSLGSKSGSYSENCVAKSDVTPPQGPDLRRPNRRPEIPNQESFPNRSEAGIVAPREPFDSEQHSNNDVRDLNNINVGRNVDRGNTSGAGGNTSGGGIAGIYGGGASGPSGGGGGSTSSGMDLRPGTQNTLPIE